MNQLLTQTQLTITIMRTETLAGFISTSQDIIQRGLRSMATVRMFSTPIVMLTLLWRCGLTDIKDYGRATNK